VQFASQSYSLGRSTIHNPSTDTAVIYNCIKLALTVNTDPKRHMKPALTLKITRKQINRKKHMKCEPPNFSEMLVLSQKIAGCSGSGGAWGWGKYSFRRSKRPRKKL